jgi:hypothetical protein
MKLKLYCAYGNLLATVEVATLELAEPIAFAEDNCVGFTLEDEDGEVVSYDYFYDSATGSECWKRVMTPAEDAFLTSDPDFTIDEVM